MKTMKNTFRRSTTLITFIAAFAMIIIGCSKKDSPANGGGSDTTKYEITIANNIAHGSVSASLTSATAGTTITLNATPEVGYTLVYYNVYNTNNPQTTVQVNNNSFTMPAYNVTVSAIFGQLPGSYGTITVAGQSYNIAAGVHEIFYDDDLGQNVVTLELADRVNGSSDTNGFVAEIIGIDNLPANGTYQFILQEQMPAGSCAGCFVSSQGLLYCTSGTITVSGTSASYNIQASGSAMPMGGGNNMSFSVNFNGPLPLYEE